MTVMERTRQQLDPIGSLPARLLAVALSAGALAYGITMTIRAAEEIVNPVLAVLALIWLAGAAVTVAIASSSSRAPFTMSTHLVVQLLGLGVVHLEVRHRVNVLRLALQDERAGLGVPVAALLLPAPLAGGAVHGAPYFEPVLDLRRPRLQV